MKNCQTSLYIAASFDRFVRLHSGLAWSEGKTTHCMVDRICVYPCMIIADKIFLPDGEYKLLKINCIQNHVLVGILDIHKNK